MTKKIIALALTALLSGCSLLNSNSQDTQAQMDTLTTNQQEILSHLVSISDNVSSQKEYIERLESEIINLNNEVDTLQQRQKQYIRSQRPTQQPNINSQASSNLVVSNLESQERSGMVILGSLEKIHLDAIKMSFTARIDTGATTSSINAIDVQQFERNGNKWVRFHVLDAESKEEKRWIESPIVRHVKIRQSTSDDLERRPVVELWIKIGKVHEKAQFTLADRSQMDYPILLGREFIKDAAYVDVSRQFIESTNN